MSDNNLPHSAGQRPAREDALLHAVLALLAELRADRLERRRWLDEFAAVYLKARFPFGKPVDRWRRG